MTDKERLECLLDYLKKEKIVRNQQDFVERIGENPTVVSSYKSGKRPFSTNFVYKVHKTFPFVSEDWLKGEEVEMILGSEVMEQTELQRPMDQERLVELGGESFAAKMLELFRKGFIFSYESYKLQSEEYRKILDGKDDKIEDLNQEIGKLKAIIEILKGKKPEDMLK